MDVGRTGKERMIRDGQGREVNEGGGSGKGGAREGGGARRDGEEDREVKLS